MSTLGFYRAFEERFYAPRSTIKNLRQQYLPFVQPLAALYPGAPLLTSAVAGVNGWS